MIRIRLTLDGHAPEIWRELLIDDALSLADVRRVIDTAFEGPHCTRHLFTDMRENSGWSPNRRRWGDRWTMIDLRDPTVIDEDTVRLRDVVGELPLALVHTCNPDECVIIETGGQEIALSASPAAVLVSGERARPFACCRNPFEHEVLVGVLGDAEHPEHDALRRAIDHASGPWGRYDPESWDETAARRTIDQLTFDGPHRARNDADRANAAPLASLARTLPRAARAAFERHVQGLALDLPAMVTSDEAMVATRRFRWIIERAAAEDLTFVDGDVDQGSLREGADEFGCEVAEMRRLVAVARRLHLIYRRSGLFRANKRALTVASDPIDLWNLIAREIASSSSAAFAPQLLLLAIVDGSLGDPSVGARRCADALALTSAASWRGWSMWDDDGRPGDCGQRCDCPRDQGGSWHDVVTRSIRAAALHGRSSPRDAQDGPRALMDGLPEALAEDLRFPPEWMYDGDYGLILPEATAGAVEAVGTHFLDQAADTLALLSHFGLEQTESGHWRVPPTVREFARTCLQTATQRYPMF